LHNFYVRKAIKKKKKTNAPAQHKKYINLKILNEDYDHMLRLQGGVCAICNAPHLVNKKFAVDHNHETGIIRGLLCSNCNAGLGMFKDSMTLLADAVFYLRVRDGLQGNI